MHQHKLGVAIHGAGWVAGAHAASWLKNSGAQIVSISDVASERAQKLADRYGLGCATGDRFEDVLRDERVDVVDITGPSCVHAEQAMAAAEAGKHVMVEKPMGITLQETRALRDTIARTGVRSLVGFVLRWNPAVVTIRALLESAAIGDVFYAEVDYWHGLGPSHHAWDLHSKKRTGGSAMLLGGCHAVDALRWLIREEAVEVTALSNNQKGSV